MRVLFLVFVFPASCVFAGQLPAWLLSRQAVELYTHGDPCDSDILFRDALESYQRKDSLIGWIRTYRAIGKVLKDPADQSDFLQTALEAMWRTPANKEEWVQVAWLKAAIGYSLFNDQNRIAESVKWYYKAADIFEDTLQLVNGEVAWYIYNTIGNLNNQLHDFYTAAHYRKKALAILEKEQNWTWFAETCNNLGFTYFDLKAYDQAKSFFHLGLSKKDSITSVRPLVNLLLNLGLCHIETHQLDSALHYTRLAQAALDVDTSLSDEIKASLQFDVYTNYGKLFQEQKNYARSEKDLKKALQYAPSIREKALGTLNLAELYLKWKKPGLAAAGFQNALTHLLPDFTPASILSNPEASFLAPENLVIQALAGKADAFLQQNRWQEAAACYDLAGMAENLLYRTYFLQESGISLIADLREIKSRAFQAYYNLWQKTGDKTMLEKLFAISEKSRAWQMLDHYQKREQIESAGYQADFDRLQQQISAWETDLISNPNLQDSLHQARKQLNELIRSLPVDSIYATIDLARARQTLAPGEAMVAYFRTPDQVFAFLLQSDQGSRLLAIPWNEQWDTTAAYFQETIFTRDNPGYLDQASRLYQQLVQPVLMYTDAQHLILAPDGVLWNIPFQALLTREQPAGKTVSFKRLPYLAREKSLSYAFSASTWIYQHQAKGTGKKRLVFAPAYRKPDESDSGSQLDSLLFNQQEGKQIARIIHGRLFQGGKATKQQFSENLEGAGFLHIAGHAKANKSAFNGSFIAFSNLEDSLFKIYVSELYDRKLALEMIGLSGCETGAGKLAEGEGVLSIARGFAFAGARSTITTQWAINDEATQSIMVDFYRNLDQKMPKNQALQAAQIAWIDQAADSDRAHPKYWAAFSVIGYCGPVDFQNNQWSVYIFIALALIFLLLAGFLIILKRRHGTRLPGSPLFE